MAPGRLPQPRPISPAAGSLPMTMEARSFPKAPPKVTSTIFKNCQGNNGGALAIYGGTVTLTSSTFTNCQASYGGAIYSSGVTPSITSSTFTGCSAGSGPGAIAISSGSISMNFSRIYQDGTEAVLVSSGSGSADNNWWGQNSGPATGEVSGITVNSWLILGAIASPSTLYTTGTSAIQANSDVPTRLHPEVISIPRVGGCSLRTAYLSRLR